MSGWIRLRKLRRRSRNRPGRGKSHLPQLLSPRTYEGAAGRTGESRGRITWAIQVKTAVEIEAEPGLREVLAPSLETDQKVSYTVDSDGEKLVVTVETDSLGALRGATDTVFRLAMLGNRILKR